jgi:hypothetical protein
MKRSDSQVNLDIWAALARDILYYTTGVIWETKTKIELWDGEIRFQYKDIKHATPSLNMNDSEQINFTHVLSTVVQITHYWRREHDSNRS